LISQLQHKENSLDMNDNKIDIMVLELLASRVCHDLISPIGAVNNGIEFLDEMGADAGQEAVDLIAHSAAVASSRLKVFRLAYGLGGRDPNIKPSDVKDVFEGLISKEDKIKQEWDPYGALGFDEYPEGFSKILMGALLLASECLPKGGIIKVDAGDGDNHTVVTAEGENAAPRSQFSEALNLDIGVENVEPVLVHPYVLGILSGQYGFNVSFSNAVSGKVSIDIKSS